MPRRTTVRNSEHSSRSLPKSYDRTDALDELNLNILKDLVVDPETRSQELARQYGRPLSTIQRRRTRLERALLIKRYEIDYSKLGSRQSDLMISIGRGDSEDIVRRLLEMHADNILSISIRIGDPEINLMARVVYTGTEELHQIIEGIKSVPSVRSVDWSELVRVVAANGKADNQGRIIDRIFRNRHNPRRINHQG